uniref:Uncharacterized protein n=1 Tax=Nelumbo nucifera TaxID=4432 RepID=A0A822YJ19_NELNU|nr:TPA_asm: hypothetical protein HUJ06_010964 [Nelumbo nucifera]
MLIMIDVEIPGWLCDSFAFNLVGFHLSPTLKKHSHVMNGRLRAQTTQLDGHGDATPE